MSYNSHWRESQQPPYHGIKGCKIIYDDCNHNSYRVIKNGKFITKKGTFIPKTFYRNGLHRLWQYPRKEG